MQLAYVKKYAAEDMLWLYDDLSNIAGSYEYKYGSLNVVLERVGEYRQRGRYQNERQAQDMDTEIRKVLDAKLMTYTVAKPSEIDAIEDYVITHIHKDGS
jgi:hypothetical protein